MGDISNEKVNVETVDNSHQPSAHNGEYNHHEGEVVAGGANEYINGVPYWRTKLFLGSLNAIGFGALACYAGFAMPANTLALINEDIGPSPNINWVALAWTLTLAVGYTLVGRLSDIFGRRYFFIGGATLALIGSIIAATAKNVNTLIGATVFIGLGASSQISFTYVIGELVPVRHRFIIVGLINAYIIPVGAFGPVIARSFILHTAAKWRWNFYLTIILNVISLLLWVLFYFPPNFEHLHRKRSRWQEVKDIDYVGIVLFTGGMLLLLMGLSWGGTQYAWKSAHVIATIVVGFCTLVAFVLYECFSGVYRPLVPMHIFRDFQYDVVVVITTVGGMIYYSMTVVYPIVLGVLYSTDVMTVGWLSCAVGGGVQAGQVIGGMIAVRVGYIKWQMVMAALMMTAFIGGLAVQTPNNKHLSTAFAFLGCLGVGWIEVLAATTATFVIKNQKQMGTSNGVFGSIRSAGGVLATTIYLAILLNVVASNTESMVVPAVLQAGLPESSLVQFLTALSTGSAQAIEAVPGITPQIVSVGSQELVAAYVGAIKLVFLASIAFGGCAIIASLACRPITKLELSGGIVYHLDKAGAGTETVKENGEEAAVVKEAPLE